MNCTRQNNPPDLPGATAGQRLDRSGKRTLAYFTAACASLLLASIIYAPWASTGPVLCPFRFITGMPCPGCGLTRSFCAMSGGRFAAAFGYHLFGPALYFAALFSIPLMIYQIVTARRIVWFHRLCYSRRFARILAVSLGGYHLVRIMLLIASGQLIPSITHAPVLALLKHL